MSSKNSIWMNFLLPWLISFAQNGMPISLENIKKYSVYAKIQSSKTEVHT